MKRPVGELVQFDFYFHQKHRNDAMSDVVRYCLCHGASLSGETVIAQFDKARFTRMNSVYNQPNHEKAVDQQGLWRQFNDDDISVLAVGIWNAIGSSKRTPDIITFTGVSEDAPLDEPNPISIVGEGWVFSTPGYEDECNRMARKLQGRFVEACDTLRPTYAAILNEDSLACPYDLRKGKGIRCFENFFISHDAFGSEVIAIIEAMYADAYTQRLAGGIYVSTWIFSPKNLVVEGKSRNQRSRTVARILADHLACQGNRPELFDS